MNATAQPMTDRLSLFESLITDLVMEGGDADTNACFAGAVLGAYLGYTALPPQWKNGLTQGAWIMGKAEGLCDIIGITKGDYDGKKDSDTALDGGKGILTRDQLDNRWAEFNYKLLAEAKSRRDEEKEREDKEKRKSVGKALFGWRK